jgi:hypothetical protein
MLAFRDVGVEVRYERTLRAFAMGWWVRYELT